MKTFAIALALTLWLGAPSPATAQTPSSATRPARTRPGTPGEQISPPTQPAEHPRAAAAPQPAEAQAGAPAAGQKIHWDMTEAAPIVSHHAIAVHGRTLHYSATVGRLPIRDASGTIEAEMFFVAYTLDGGDPARRPLTFAFNGGPGSASMWLHMGALGPRKVVLAKDGFMPASPYRLMDNPETPLDRTDLVLVDAIGTGFSRPADSDVAKKFWGLSGDVQSFGEFVRLYITRYDRWRSPLYILGESYGTTRAAGIAGYLVDRGIVFNGIALLSMVLDFETLEITKKNDLACILTLPSYTMIAAYHHKLAPELQQNPAHTREEAERWASTDYAAALAKGDALTPDERRAVVAQFSRYTGLDTAVVDEANLRVNVGLFTRYLLADRRLHVGRLDGRFAAPDPNGFFDTQGFDPTSAAITPPFVSVLNDYVRRELGYRTDMPYFASASEVSSSPDEPGLFRRWDWGPAREGFPDTATPLRAAMIKDPYLKVLVMEGYYDLATPYAAANYTMNHLDLGPQYRSNISFATYDAGHMVYLRESGLAKMTHDFEEFIDRTSAR